MDVLKITGLSGIAVAVILTACSRTPSPLQPFVVSGPTSPAPRVWRGPTPQELIDNPRILEGTDTIVLVRVVEVVEWEKGDPTLNFAPLHYATMLVLKSWAGPYPAGHLLRTPKGYLTCNGRLDLCGTYNFQFEDKNREFLIISPGGPVQPGGTEIPDEIPVPPAWIWPAAESQALMAALDQALDREVADSIPTDKKGYLARLEKESAALEDVETKMQAVADRRTALEKQLPGDAAAFNQAGVELNKLHNLASWHRERAARWQQELRTLGWTPPSCDPSAPCARASAP